MNERAGIRLAAAGLVAAVTLATTSAALAAWPERPVTLIVPWSAGGGTDATGRIVASMLEERLGQPFNVVNRTGGGGVVGHTDIANAAPDGYTLGVITTELSMFHWIGTSPLTFEDYSLFGLYNTDPTAIHVRADFEAADLGALLEMVDAAPGQHKASGANQGGAAHLGLAGLLQASGRAPDAIPWIPAEGAAPSLQLLVSDAIDVVSTTMPEVRSLVDAGEVRTLAVMASERDPAFPDIPTVAEAIDVDWTTGAWRGIAGPAGMPEEVAEVLVPALEEIVASAEFKEFMAGRGFGVTWAAPDDFAAYLATADANFGAAMQAVGLAK
ncbi:MAG: tripartite tricarboxylate transporter substrate binding protein [Geminicoccaceae bacterium]|jgi:tripartite-type tricarboxylate transporter receptor subunit TctC|nr:tripartite tricarboxylate transporter substrate binding protein [Geminicoccaceae bacterium]HRY23849.1 tripartite tricarboxylate transporter substrate binding protein [Geminicoccaceae bacterium]